MDSENINNKFILYLKGNLSNKERLDIEKMIKEDSNVREEFEFTKLLFEGIKAREREKLLDEIREYDKQNSSSFSQKISAWLKGNWIIVALVVIGTLLIPYYIWTDTPNTLNENFVKQKKIIITQIDSIDFLLESILDDSLFFDSIVINLSSKEIAQKENLYFFITEFINSWEKDKVNMISKIDSFEKKHSLNGFDTFLSSCLNEIKLTKETIRTYKEAKNQLIQKHIQEIEMQLEQARRNIKQAVIKNKNAKITKEQTQKNMDKNQELIKKLNDQKIIPIKINTQQWSSKNLTVNIDKSDGTYSIEAGGNPKEYGYLYSWKAAKKACPPDWKLPSLNDWTNLINNNGGYAEGFDNTGNNTVDNLRKVGFELKLSGRYNQTTKSNPDFMDTGFYWTSTEHNEKEAVGLIVSKDGKISRGKFKKTMALSCRCIAKSSL